MDHTYDTIGTVDLQGASAGFFIRSIVIQNQTPLWLRVGAYGYVTPFTLNAVISVPGVQSISVTREAPAGVTEATGRAIDHYFTTITDEVMLPNPGVPYAGGASTFVATFIQSQRRPSPGAGLPLDVLTATAQGIVENNGGVKRMLIRALPTNVATVWLGFATGVIGSSGSLLPLGPGDAVVVAYTAWGQSPAVLASGVSWGQLWFDGAAPDAVAVVILE